MEFKIDEQTLNDLELFNQALDGKSIFSCFNTACSDGGKACIRKMLESPCQMSIKSGNGQRRFAIWDSCLFSWIFAGKN